jgi:drug/metabolite transporter (DMT)-like permease
MITGALAAIGFAITIILTKKLTQTTTITCILFYLTGMQALFGLIFAGIDGDIAVPTAANTPWIILIGCAGLMAHFCLTTALSLAPATIVVPIDFARLPAIAIVGMLFYNEPIDAFVLIGALVIFGANYLNIWSENRPKPSLQSTS